MEIFVKNENFRQKWKFSSKMKIFVKNGNFQTLPQSTFALRHLVPTHGNNLIIVLIPPQFQYAAIELQLTCSIERNRT